MAPSRGPSAAGAELALSLRQLSPRTALLVGGLICVLVAQGMAVTASYLWAAPLMCLLVVALAPDIPLIPSLGVILLVRILTDASLSSRAVRHSGALNLSGAIAVLFMLVALGLLIRRRHGMWPAVLVALWLSVWTVVAVKSHGESTETIREGVREAAIGALGIIVYNSRGVLNVSVVTRMIQVVGIASALLAVYQFGTHSGLNINSQIRANGTFVHPDGAAMFFAVATTASVWRYFDTGRRRSDALFATAFAAATIATFSLGGLASLLVMLMVYGTLRPGSVRLKFGAYAVAGLVTLAFLATPLGAERFAKATTTSLSSAPQGRHEVNTSLAWRFYKWQTLIPEWEQAPFFGQGLGTTVTAEGNSENTAAGLVPHSEYIRTLVETGAVGFIFVAWAVAMLIRQLARCRRIPDTFNAGTLGMAIFVGCLVNALADNTFLYSTTAYPVIMILAAVIGLRQIGATSATPPVRRVVAR